VTLFLATLFSGPWAIVARFAALAIAISGIFGYGWIKGNEHGTAKLAAYQGEQAIASAKLVVVQGAVTTRVEKAYIDRVKTVKEKGDAIIQTVPIYITAENDSACYVSNGARIVHDSAAINTLPAPPSGDNGASSGLKLSTVLTTVAANYKTYHEVAARLTACQGWIREQFEAANGARL
jgi:hypothetical protein